MIKQILNPFFLLLTDIVATLIALVVSHFIRIEADNLAFFQDYDANLERFTFSGLLFFFLVSLFYFFGLYTKRNDFWEESRTIIKAIFFLFIFLFTFVFITKTSTEYSRAMVVMMFANMLWLLPLGRLGIKIFLSKLGLWQINAYIEGQGSQIENLRKNLSSNRFLGYEIVDSKMYANVVFIATKGMSINQLEALIQKYKRVMKEVILLPYLHDISFANADIIDLKMGRMSMINIQNQLYKTKNIVIKKVMEVLLVLLMLPLLIVVYGVLALLVKLDSSGSALFRQTRMGKDGRLFTCYKFRTMYEDSDALLTKYLEDAADEVAYYELYHKYQNDPRITPIGRVLRKFSLDELPQMINVLKGEMNLIGPRPYLVSEKEKMAEDVETILHVAPGITGFWQISGRNDLNFKERVELDTWYIQNWSLWLDFIIFMKTFLVLLSRKGAK